MKKAFAWIFFLALVWGGSYLGGQAWQARSLLVEEEGEKDNGFRPAEFTLQERSFVFVVCGHNNGAFVEKTIRSIFSQVHSSYRLIYIDDASTDGSFIVAKEVADRERTTFIQNRERKGTLACWVEAVEGCADEEIVVLVGGEDWLAHEWVLQRLNEYYADADLWMTYGQFCEFPSYRTGFSRAYRQKETPRDAPFVASHLKTFYAGLFKRLSPGDWALPGALSAQVADVAITIPLLELAASHSQFVPDVLYVANRQGGASERDQLSRFERQIRARAPLEPLDEFRERE